MKPARRGCQFSLAVWGGVDSRRPDGDRKKMCLKSYRHNASGSRRRAGRRANSVYRLNRARKQEDDGDAEVFDLEIRKEKRTEKKNESGFFYPFWLVGFCLVIITSTNDERKNDAVDNY